MKIMYKMIIGFLIVVIISLISGIASINMINSINDEVSFVQQEKYPVNKDITNYQRGASNLWIGTYMYVNGDTTMGNQYIRNGKKMMKESRENLLALENKIDLEEIYKKEVSAIEASDKIMDEIKTGSTQDQIKLDLNIMQQRVASLDLALTSEVSKSQGEMIELLDDAKEKSQATVTLNTWTLILSAIISLMIAILISIMITRPLNKLSEAADKLTDGDMTAEVPILNTKDEIQKLGGLIAMQASIIKMHQQEKQNAAKAKAAPKKK